jgi:transposase
VDDINALKAIILASQAKMVDQDGIIKRKEERFIRLEKLLADFKRTLYGAKSERANPDQYHLALEDIETAMAVVHA